MKNKFKAVAIMTLSFLLCITTVFAEPKNDTLLANGPIDIGARVGKPELNILDNSNIVFRDTEGNIVDNPSINSKVVVRFDWTLLNEDSLLIQDGDYYSFKLPEVFKIHTEMNGNLDDYGTFKIDTFGTVTFTFNEAVSQSSNVKGYIEFDAKFNEEIIGGPGEKVIELPISKDNEFKFNVTPISKDTSIEKSGKPDKELNPSQITWEVKINKAYETLSNVVVQDTLPLGLTLEGIEVYPVNLNHNGSFHSYGDKLSTTLYNVEGPSVSFNDVINQPYAIRYITKIDETVKPNGGGDVTFKNHATMSSKENDVIVTDATIIASYGRLLTKQKPSYNAADQSFTWTVHYNYGEKTIQNPLLEDIFDGDLEYVAGSFAVTDSNGKPVNYQYTLSNDPKNKLNIQFEEAVSKALKLTYKTKIKDGKLIVENKDYSNSITTGNTSSGSVGTAKPQMVNKTTPSIDYKNKLIDWKIDVNINHYEMRQYSLTDTYTYKGLSLVDASFEVYDTTKKRVVDPVNYELVKRYDNDVEIGFQLLFKGEYETTSSQLQVRFKTNYDVNNLIGGDGSTFRNHVSLDWKDKDNVSHKHTSQADRKVNSQTIKNGQKSGSYNAITKEITWKVDVNYNSEDLKNAKIVDVIQVGQKYIDGSLVLKTYTVDTNGNLVANGEMEDLSLFDIEYPDAVNNNTLTISLPNKNDLKYSIEFKTSVRSEAVKANYKNKAIFTNGEYVRNLDASVTVTNGEKYVSKTGKQNGSLIHWSIAINESQSTIKDAELHDYPSNNQILMENTFKLYPVTIRENGTYTIDYDNPLKVDKDYVVLFNTDVDGKQVFVLKFLTTIDRTYVLEYDSQISTTPDNKTISNRVSLKGKELSYEDSGGTSSIVIDVNQAGGGAVGVKGSLTIQKTDENGKPLEGVEFELYNPLNRKVATRLTNAEGKIEFVGMVYGNFTIKETKALEGYVIDEALFNGKVIAINEETSNPNHIVIFKNRMNTVTINKQNLKGESLNGAEFKLEKKKDTDYELIHQSISLPNGQIVLSGLKSGMYRLTELVAPQGYVRNLESLEFEITENAIGQAEDITVSYTNYKGSVRLKKTGETGDVLPGVTFNLYDINDNLVLENLVSDTDGEVYLENQLSPGEYYFMEKEAVDGYIVNESPYHFEIGSESTGIPPVVEVKAVNYRGSVEFKKVGENGEILSDIEFELYLLGEETPNEKVMSDEQGMVRVNQLAPGTYYFKEVKQKEGYIVNSKQINFTIPQKANHERVIVTLDDFINYQGSVMVEKVDPEGKRIGEAIFELRDSQGNKVAEQTTTHGLTYFSQLQPGTYTLIEILAPKGYVGSTIEYHIDIVSEYEGVYIPEKVTVVNEKEISILKPENPNYDVQDIEELPETGVSNILGHSSIISLILGMVMLGVNKKRSQNLDKDSI